MVRVAVRSQNGTQTGGGARQNCEARACRRYFAGKKCMAEESRLRYAVMVNDRQAAARV